MEYEDFEVRIRSDRKDGLEIETISLPYRNRETAPFDPPYEPPAVEELLGSLEDVLRTEGRARDLAPRTGTGGRSVETKGIGERLFRSLFRGDEANAFETCFACLEEKGRTVGLRLRLLFEPGDPRLAAASALPWEFLLRPKTGDFLARQRRCSVVRCVEVPRAFPPPRVDSALRVLVVGSAPASLPELDIAKELKAIRDSAGGRFPLDVEVLDHPTISQLHPALLRTRPHVLHFIGHGAFDDREGGFVYFESEHGSPERITAANLAENLKDLEALRLVVLNSCSGGTLPRRGGQDPFSSVAPALLQAGVPAVVAMQFPIADDAAIAFSKAFYERLAEGDLVEPAVAEGRLAIYNSDTDSFEWATPVLFLATHEGKILDLRDPHPPAPSPGTGEGETVAPRPLRLGIRSFAGPDSLAMNMENETDRMLPLEDLFQGRSIRSEELWQTEVFPRVQAFLMSAASERGPIEMSLAAHASIAFAAGYCLGTKSGLDISIWQSGRSTRQLWRGESLSLPEQPLWQDESVKPGSPGTADVALAVSVTRDVLPDVKAYQTISGLKVRRILTASLLSGPGHEGVRDGAHALQLAQSLSWKIQSRTLKEREGVLHLFASAPNGLLFFLGQLCRGLGRIQLYEHDFDSSTAGAYRPSILLPWSAR